MLRSGVLLIALKQFSAVSRYFVVIIYEPLVLILVPSVVVRANSRILRKASCSTGRKFWVAIRAVGFGTHVAVVGHDAAV
eukprot:scaffold174504_cov63-Attheya_sp.AAC.1